jgi:hypothetical protein
VAADAIAPQKRLHGTGKRIGTRREADHGKKEKYPGRALNRHSELLACYYFGGASRRAAKTAIDS